MAANKAIKVSGGAKATIDHDEIREWVEAHGGHPSMVERTARNGKGGILRIDFPGFSGERSLQEVSWDDFFEKFEDSQLAFLYQDATKSGRPSRFNKLVARDTVQVGSSAKRRAPKRATGRTARPAQAKVRRKTSKSAASPAKKKASKRATGRSTAKVTRKRAVSKASPRRTVGRGASPRASTKKAKSGAKGGRRASANDSD